MNTIWKQNKTKQKQNQAQHFIVVLLNRQQCKTFKLRKGGYAENATSSYLCSAFYSIL